MAAKSLGKVTGTAAAGARFTVNESVPATRYPVQGYSCQALQGNTGVVYICNSNVAPTGVWPNVVAVVPIPSSSDGKSLPLFGQDNPSGQATFDLSTMYVFPAVNGEGVLIGATRS